MMTMIAAAVAAFFTITPCDVAAQAADAAASFPPPGYCTMIGGRCGGKCLTSAARCMRRPSGGSCGCFVVEAPAP